MRSIFYLTSASVLALGLACAGPAFATAGSAGQNAAANTVEGQGPTRVEINNDLHRAGVTDRQSVRAHLVWARSPSGQSVAFLIGPENMQAGKTTGQFDENKLRSDLSKAGFKNIDFARKAELLRGRVPGNQLVLAFESQYGAPKAKNYVDPNKLDSELRNAGLSDGHRWNAQLFRAATPTGNTWFALIAPKGAHRANISDKEIDKFERNGFIDANMYNNNMAIVQGRLNNLDVIAVAGSNIGPAA
jgi:hypothetical protein